MVYADAARVDSIFLKSARRIEALMMVMALCLLVYNFAENRLRTVLQEKKETLPNQLGKKVQNPTLRWVFQILEGIMIVCFYDNPEDKPLREVVTNLTELKKKTISLFGQMACDIYGIDHQVTPKKIPDN